MIYHEHLGVYDLSDQRYKRMFYPTYTYNTTPLFSLLHSLLITNLLPHLLFLKEYYVRFRFLPLPPWHDIVSMRQMLEHAARVGGQQFVYLVI